MCYGIDRRDVGVAPKLPSKGSESGKHCTPWLILEGTSLQAQVDCKVVNGEIEIVSEQKKSEVW